MTPEEIPTDNIEGTISFSFPTDSSAAKFIDFVEKSNYYDPKKHSFYKFFSKETRVSYTVHDWNGLDSYYEFGDSLTTIANHYGGTYTGCTVICRPSKTKHLQGTIPAIRESDLHIAS